MGNIRNGSESRIARFKGKPEKHYHKKAIAKHMETAPLPENVAVGAQDTCKLTVEAIKE